MKCPQDKQRTWRHRCCHRRNQGLGCSRQDSVCSLQHPFRFGRSPTDMARIWSWVKHINRGGPRERRRREHHRVRKQEQTRAVVTAVEPTTSRAHVQNGSRCGAERPGNALLIIDGATEVVVETSTATIRRVRPTPATKSRREHSWPSGRIGDTGAQCRGTHSHTPVVDVGACGRQCAVLPHVRLVSTRGALLTGRGAVDDSDAARRTHRTRGSRANGGAAKHAQRTRGALPGRRYSGEVTQRAVLAAALTQLVLVLAHGTGVADRLGAEPTGRTHACA